jgi:hypothetical protein
LQSIVGRQISIHDCKYCAKILIKWADLLKKCKWANNLQRNTAF